MRDAESPSRSFSANHSNTRRVDSPHQYLLDIANQLASEDNHAESAKAYEKFLAHYGAYEYVDQVELMLGVLYSRYLDEPELALKHLRAAADKLTDPPQKKMCDDELAKLQQ